MISRWQAYPLGLPTIPYLRGASTRGGASEPETRWRHSSESRGRRTVTFLWDTQVYRRLW
jgi:hypothetical protein